MRADSVYAHLAELERGDPSSLGLHRVLRRRGELLLAMGDAPHAVSLLEEAADDFERRREQAGAAWERVTFSRTPYDLLAVTCIEAGDPEGAWHAVERSTARVLTDLLAATTGREPGAASAREGAADVKGAAGSESGNGVEPIDGAERLREELPADLALIGWHEVLVRGKGWQAWAYVVRAGRSIDWVSLPAATGRSGVTTTRRLRGDLSDTAAWPMRVGASAR